MRANDWHDPQWQAQAHSWIRDTLDGLNSPVIGEIEETRVRPWSVTHRATTAAGIRWFKANTRACAYEAGLAKALAGWIPQSVLTPLAVDENRGWLLTADCGPTLRETRPGDLPAVREMLQAYAVLQRTLAPKAPEMTAIGVPDMRPSVLPERLATLLSEEPVDGEVDVTAYGKWCAELAADGVPASLQHDDLHDDNVFPGNRFFDWGDAAVAHPFGCLLVALSSIDATESETRMLRDAYLEVWSDLAPAETLRRSATLACRTARVPKAAAWQRAVRDAALPVEDDFRTAAAYYLAEIGQPTPV
ncbi:aminoglycoside phosphotransferase family protein [Actinoplanes bogorensis]|uniref:Aminoglycoside phosphotransferase family protein n=1 Tax=Paractinoplanes bogorensis TaxID=1610840 RepID=A0ABS5YKS0_9ACTN|nr:phosphotransferase [Actinoplanes bogorensis]MBU2662550.1 aminoglycoside phosphotransferase family protein [Actinoplanes bogorensis]